MAETRTLGLSSIEISDIASDGGIGATFAPLGVTYKDSAELTSDEPEITEHYSEENDEPEETISKRGLTKIKWSIIDSDADTLVKILGGTATGTAPNKVWSAPSSVVDIEKSIKITPKAGKAINIVRARLVAKINYKLSRTGILLIDIVATVLTPKKADTDPYTIG